MQSVFGKTRKDGTATQVLDTAKGKECDSPQRVAAAQNTPRAAHSADTTTPETTTANPGACSSRRRILLSPLAAKNGTAAQLKTVEAAKCTVMSVTNIDHNPPPAWTTVKTHRRQHCLANNSSSISSDE